MREGRSSENRERWEEVRVSCRYCFGQRGFAPPRKSGWYPEAGTTIPIIISHGVGTPGGEWRRPGTVCPCRKRGKVTEETPFRLH